MKRILAAILIVLATIGVAASSCGDTPHNPPKIHQP